jgi:hypothetical protein
MPIAGTAIRIPIVAFEFTTVPSIAFVPKASKIALMVSPSANAAKGKTNISQTARPLINR